MNAFLVALSLIADAIIGDPPEFWRRIPHPIVVIGKAIGWLDVTFNREDRSEDYRRLAGTLCLLVLLAAGFVAASMLQSAFLFLPFGWIVLALLASIFIAQKSLYVHVKAVQDGLTEGGLDGGRKAVAQIVGRDPERLDEAGISRAAIESCAENFSDGIVAPAFWFAVLGFPGLVAYKIVNTADSMIGHRTPRHAAFGWASARFDDLVNWPAARLSAVLVAIAARLFDNKTSNCLQVCLRDAATHRSPNAGWPEAAFASSLGIALAGPRIYDGKPTDDPYINAEGRRDIDAGDIGKALHLLRAACGVQIGLYLILAALFRSFS